MGSVPSNASDYDDDMGESYEKKEYEPTYSYKSRDKPVSSYTSTYNRDYNYKGYKAKPEYASKPAYKSPFADADKYKTPITKAPTYAPTSYPSSSDKVKIRFIRLLRSFDRLLFQVLIRLEMLGMQDECALCPASAWLSCRSCNSGI